jgi:hypothetical protein
VLEKGMPNPANYVSVCYPSLPMGQNSVIKYQKAMVDKLKKRKEATNMSNRTYLFLKIILDPRELKESRSLNRRQQIKSKSIPKRFHSHHKKDHKDHYGKYMMQLLLV